MNKRIRHLVILPIALIGICCNYSCQKATLIEEWPENNKESDGRNSTSEQGDSITVTPNFDIDGWDEAIDATFTFGGQEQNE